MAAKLALAGPSKRPAASPVVFGDEGRPEILRLQRRGTLLLALFETPDELRGSKRDGAVRVGWGDVRPGATD